MGAYGREASDGHAVTWGRIYALGLDGSPRVGTSGLPPAGYEADLASSAFADSVSELQLLPPSALDLLPPMLRGKAQRAFSPREICFAVRRYVRCSGGCWEDGMIVALVCYRGGGGASSPRECVLRFRRTVRLSPRRLGHRDGMGNG